jgi:diguanylate cyclase (GGDEF)-like protein
VLATEIVLVLLLVLTVAGAVAAVLWARGRADARVRTVLAALGGERELAASLEPDEVVRRTLDAVTALPGVDAVLLQAGELRALRGAPAEEIDRAALETPTNKNLRALEVVYRYRLDEAEKAAGLLRAGLAVPLPAHGEPIGSLIAFSRSPVQGFPEETAVAFERLAARAGPALDNALRFVEARQLADIDSLTGLRNRRCFHELLAREVARAGRYQRRLSLIVFDLDNFKQVNDRIGHLVGDAVLAEVADRVRHVVRSSDVPGRVGGDEFGVIMPETALLDAEQLANRIGRAVAERPFSGGHKLFVSAGVAELRQDDDATELFERADEALYRAKQAGKSRTIAAQ